MCASSDGDMNHAIGDIRCHGRIRCVILRDGVATPSIDGTHGKSVKCEIVQLVF